MSLITINHNITNVLPVTGEGNVSYTCPQDKRSFVTVTMVLSLVKRTNALDGDNFVSQFINRAYTFNIEIKGGDVLTFFETGEGSSTGNLTLNTSFVINSTNTIARSLAFTNTEDTSVLYSANISYSAIEYPA